VCQPQWRASLLSNRPAVLKKSGDYSSLKKGGLNGIILILAALAWWGAAVDGKDTEWEAAVEDVSWCLSQLVTLE
jgi:hypothetical protein